MSASSSSENICPDLNVYGHPRCTLVWQYVVQQDNIAFEIFLQSAEYANKFLVKEAKNDSILSGHLWMRELWAGNDNRFREQMRMSKRTMDGLLEYLQTNCGLTPYGRLSLKETVGMFLKFVGSGATYTDIEERFQHSRETIWRHYHHILRSMCYLADQMVQPCHNQFQDVPEKIRCDSRYYPYFDGCVGAMDGTHVTLRLAPTADNHDYVNRKGRYNTNILAICDFDMLFIYADVGKEGSQNDSGVLLQALQSRRRPFPVPPLGKYYLADSAGYGLATGILTPYKNSRYHIPEFRQAGVIRDRDENFNYHHSSLRCVIERSFGVLKSRFKILQHMIKMKKDAQVHTIWACLGIHNFIRRFAADDFLIFSEHVMRDEYKAEDSDDDPTPNPYLYG